MRRQKRGIKRRFDDDEINYLEALNIPLNPKLAPDQSSQNQTGFHPLSNVNPNCPVMFTSYLPQEKLHPKNNLENQSITVSSPTIDRQMMMPAYEYPQFQNLHTLEREMSKTYQPVSSFGTQIEMNDEVISDEEMRRIRLRGGESTEVAVNKNFKALRDKGFSKEQIVKIAMSQNGLQRLQLIVNHGLTLLKKGFSPTTIVQIVMSKDARNKLVSMVSYSDTLIEKGFSQAQIEQMAMSGSAQLKEVIKHFTTLCEIKLDHNQITYIAIHYHGRKLIDHIAKLDKERQHSKHSSSITQFDMTPAPYHQAELVGTHQQPCSSTEMSDEVIEESASPRNESAGATSYLMNFSIFSPGNNSSCSANGNEHNPLSNFLDQSPDISY